jgi:SAM-dependent methyltransferase
VIEPYVRRDHTILDIGSGSGWLLREMWIAGFQHLQGVDPYIKEDVMCAPGVTVRKAEVQEIRGLFDCVMLHHVLEHLADPGAMLRRARDLLRPGATVLVRTPVAGTYAWRTYGTHWVQLDAPRHLAIQSERSMRVLAERAGLSVGKVLYDSTAFQFWGSEQNRRGIPLMDPKSVHRKPPGTVSRGDLRRFSARAAELNRDGDGDQACFYLVKR